MPSRFNNEPVERCWRVVDGPSSRLLVCAIYASGAGFEVRIRDATHRTLRSEHVEDAHAARARAEEWLTAYRAAGSVVPRDHHR